MSSPYILKQVETILNENSGSEATALACSWIIAHYKGINIKAIDAKETSSLCDYNILASTENTIQAKSIVDVIVSTLKVHGQEIISLEGMGNAEWILLDLGDIIVHIFQEVTRSSFDLDSLWSKEEQLEIPQSYYFGQAEEVKKVDPTANYF